MQDLNHLNRKRIEKKLKNNLAHNFELKIYEEIGSTNKIAKEYLQQKALAANSLNNIIIFTANRQIAGRGRKGHSWFSDDPASLAVSFLFKINKDLENIPQITAAAALAVHKTLANFGLQTKLKWPNDILVKNKKICGILSELVFDKKQGTFVIIGCGINLNNINFKKEINKIATSYYLETAKKLDKSLFLAELILEIEIKLKSYLNDNQQKIIELWKKKLALKNKKVDLVYKGNKYRVLIKAVLNTGELLVVFADGSQKKLQSLHTTLDYKTLTEFEERI